ncbi:MAG: hypothetical protein IKN54_06745, partial [Lachnospiraceae bacterium]|nr:hypothetical protein [Lachnospiraceae bacterium]
ETCCPGNKGNLSESGCGGGDYRNYCCMQDGSGHYHGGGDTQTTKCCIPGKPSDYCCTNKGKDYCGDCEGQYSSYPETFDTNCCASLSSSHKNETNWKIKCCPDNKGGLSSGSSSSAYAQACCANWSGSVTGGGTDTTNCCNVNSVASSTCCNATGTWTGTKCCKSQGIDYSDSANSKCCVYTEAANTTCCDAARASNWANGGEAYKQKCCALSDTYCGSCEELYVNYPTTFSTGCCTELISHKDEANWKNRCCPTEYGKDVASCCSGNGKDYNNNNSNNCCSWSGLSATGTSAPDHCCSSSTNTTQYSDNWKDGCCNKSSYRDESNCCQWRYDHNIWTNGTDTCCNYVTGDAWVNGCCSVNAMNTRRDFTNNDYKNCCKKLWNSGEKTYFIPDDYCCKSLGVNSKTGKDGSGNYYENCHLPCTDDSIFSTNSTYSPNATAKGCCANGNGVASGDNWAKYCCGMTDSEHSWSFPITSSDQRCCDKRKVLGTGVYAYDPYYMSNSCPAGGEKNKCAAYGYADFGFVCLPDDKCSAWKAFPSDVNLSDSEKAACCETWGNNPPDNFKDACCAVSDYASNHSSLCTNCTSTDSDGHYTMYNQGNTSCCTQWSDSHGWGNHCYSPGDDDCYSIDDDDSKNICGCAYNSNSSSVAALDNYSCCYAWATASYDKSEGYSIKGKTFEDLDSNTQKICCDMWEKENVSDLVIAYCGTCDNVSEATASKACCEYWAGKNDIWDNMSGAVQSKCCSYMKYNHKKCCTMDIYNAFGGNLSDDWCEYCIIKNKAGDYSMLSGTPKSACCDKFYDEGKDQYRLYNPNKGYYNSCCGGSGQWYYGHNKDVRDWCCHYNETGTVTWDIDIVSNSTGVAARLNSSNGFLYACGNFYGHTLVAIVTYNVDLYSATPDYLRGYYHFAPGPPYKLYLHQSATDSYRNEHDMDSYVYMPAKYLTHSDDPGFHPEKGVANNGKSNITCKIYRAAGFSGKDSWPSGTWPDDYPAGWELYSNSCSGSFPYSFKK